jgi:hypothetical protein
MALKFMEDQLHINEETICHILPERWERGSSARNMFLTISQMSSFCHDNEAHQREEQHGGMVKTSHISFSPDLMSANFHLLPEVKTAIKGRRT